MAVVLLVEDDNDLRQMLASAIGKKKHTVIEASNGRDALNKFKYSLVDLVVTDLLMPEQDGIGLIMELKKAKESLRIIAISGGGKAGPSNYLDIARTLGADAVFSKPFSLQDIMREIDKLLEE
jgi:DNA-binding response OmpR family regulator